MYNYVFEILVARQLELTSECLRTTNTCKVKQLGGIFVPEV